MASVVLALGVFAAMFVLADQAYVGMLDARFPSVGSSAWRATLWGLASRLHVIAPVLALALWQPKRFGFQVGESGARWKTLVLMLVVNCGAVAAFLWLTGDGTPFSGNQWFATETLIVPVAEEAMWRGIVLAALIAAFEWTGLRNGAAHAAVWACGLTFGTLHLANAVAGTPVPFAIVQAASAAVWGVMYGYARILTRSVYPPMALHAAMNLVVVLF